MLIQADTLQQALNKDLSVHIDTTLPGWAPDSTVLEVQCFALRDALVKKFTNEDRPSPAACRKALDKFLAVNKRCGEWVYAPCTSGEEEMLNEVKNLIQDFWYSAEGPIISDFVTIFDHGRSGPGASVSARDTDFYTKFFDSPLSSTAGLHETWKQCISHRDSWVAAERFRSEKHASVCVESSNYSFVNKNVTVARGICTEPAINMWFQLGVGRLLELRLKQKWGIDIRGGKTSPQPDVNRLLAWVGSVGGHLSTIDLESASDSLSIPMLEWLLPRTLIGLLKTLRCGSTKLPNKEEVKLNMISTMGNGFTFPLETIVFAAVVIAVAKYSGLRLEKFGPAAKRNFAVFGDDIICPTAITPRVIRVLNLLGFVVNSEKTFVEGPFRESCGADFVSGENVRGVYLKRMLTLQDRFVAINRLNHWSAKTGVKLPTLTAALLTGIRGAHRFVVPFDENDDSGIKTPSDLASKQHYCWRHGLPMRYLAHIVAPLRTKISEDGRFTHVSRRLLKGRWVEVEVAQERQWRRSYNVAGVMLALLNGTIRGYCFTSRQKELQYITKRRETPRWDYLPPQPLEGLHGPERSLRLAVAVRCNLYSAGFELG